jgi:hypothetical protein
MIRPTGIGAAPAATTARGARSAKAAFRLDPASPAPGAAVVAPPPCADVLGALIDLQGGAARERERRGKIAAAQWTLSLLDRLRLSLLDGAASDAELDALAGATAAMLACDIEPSLQAVLVDLDLRARVELAKRGR